jgi:hypothetical protein
VAEALLELRLRSLRRRGAVEARDDFLRERGFDVAWIFPILDCLAPGADFFR